MRPNNKISALIAFSLMAPLSFAQAQSLGSSRAFGGTITSILPVANGQTYVAGRALRQVPQHTANAVRISLDHADTPQSFFQGSGFGGHVLTTLVLPNPSMQVIYGGSFSNYNGEAGSAGLVRINADGTRDKSLNVGQGFNGIVSTIAQADDGSGDLWVGGTFSSYNGTTTYNLVKISTTGQLKATPDLRDYWRETGLPPIQALLPTIDGSGGVFIGAHGGGLGKLAKDGTRAPNFVNSISNNYNYDQNIVVNSLVRTDGGILVGGTFDANANNITKIKETGEIEPSFEAGHGFDATVTQISVSQDESQSIYVLGDFKTYDSVPVANHLVRLNPNGLLDEEFTPPALAPTVHSVQALLHGNVAVYGPTAYLDSGNSFGPCYYGYASCLNYAQFTILQNSGAVLNSVRVESDGDIQAVVQMQDGSLILGGSFSYYGATSPLSSVVRMNADGSLDSSFNFSTKDPISQLAASTKDPNLFFGLNDGSLYSFDSRGQVIKNMNGAYGDSLIALGNGDVMVGLGRRYHSDLTAVKVSQKQFFRTIKSQETDAMGGTVRSMVSSGDDDGSFWVAGDFNFYGKSKTGSVVKLSPDGDEKDHESKLFGKSDITSTPDYKTFWVLTATQQGVFLSTIDHGGSLKKSFQPKINCEYGYQHRLLLGAQDQSVYVVAQCQSEYGRFTDNKEVFQKFRADGTEDATFSQHSAHDGSITSIVNVPGSSDFIIAGSFTSYNGENGGGIARVHADGTLAE